VADLWPLESDVAKVMISVCIPTSTAREEARIEGSIWHCNRHTFASRLVMAGVDLRTVADLLGEEDEDRKHQKIKALTKQRVGRARLNAPDSKSYFHPIAYTRTMSQFVE
jgi:hypothetical protein